MEGLKTWNIDYSIKRKNGEITEEIATVEAASIAEALTLAQKNIVDMWPNINPEVEKAVIWNVGIVADPDDKENVF